MSIQPYEDKSKDANQSSGALVVLPNGLQITEEEHEKRLKDAEVLGEKLKFITEKVPTRIMNISGSNAGAGSGEFHMYRGARRREQMRIQRLDQEQAEEDANKEFEERKRKKQEEDSERTAKRRAQRQKKKAKDKGGKGANGHLPEIQNGQEAAKASEEPSIAVPSLD